MTDIRTILHPTDFSPRSEYALQLAVQLVKQAGGRLLLLHVVEPQIGWSVGRISPPIPAEVRERARDRLSQVWPPDPVLRVQHLLAEGEPAAAILHAAQEHQCDLIVMGTHGRTGLDRVVLGSVAEQVVRKACCPVLTVKVPAAAEPAMSSVTATSGAAAC